ncbi:hypothetical protein H4219_002395 [Mycoemilia scoparia]|uniref:Uncharacterized protein n=1 Tax=Mycoemilia scoparia TaxID=417184 RepID=A0A9W8A452_9FUNG|nr:hypothetical protein H4219_002395 [Mycoemilia scoparia]
MSTSIPPTALSSQSLQSTSNLSGTGRSSISNDGQHQASAPGYGSAEHFESPAFRGTKPAEFQWVKASEGIIPVNAVQGGIEKTGEPLYIARLVLLSGIYEQPDMLVSTDSKSQTDELAFYKDGLHPGKAGKHLERGFSMSYDSKEIKLPEYYVLCGNASRLRWVEQDGPVVINDYTPVPGGHEAGGESLYVGKVVFDGGQQIGKCSSHFKKGMVFGYAGKEKNESKYMILAYL